jgi:formylglycine-generating enzyme required for sulfatase activity
MHKPSARVLVFSTMLVGLIGLVWFLRSSKASQLQQTKTEIAAERREEPQQETADVVLTQQNDTNIPYDIHGSIAAAPIMISTGLAAVATPQADRSEADRTAELRQSSAFTNQPVAEIELELVWIAPGSFVMGSPENEQGRRSNEGPQTHVTITQGFWMGKYEVTFSQYEGVMGEIKPWRYLNTPREECANRAVHGIRWRGAMQFCERLSQQEHASGRLPDGYIYRLPTEAEWEYACRAGTTTRFSFGDDESL